MKLIVADKWAQYYSEERNRTPVANDYEAGQNDALDRVDTWMEEQPTIEAAPVVHGRWKPVKYNAHCSCGKSYGTYHYLCSACNRIAYAQPYGLNYCPNCGARMDGGEK